MNSHTLNIYKYCYCCELWIGLFWLSVSTVCSILWPFSTIISEKLPRPFVHSFLVWCLKILLIWKLWVYQIGIYFFDRAYSLCTLLIASLDTLQHRLELIFMPRWRTFINFLYFFLNLHFRSIFFKLQKLMNVLS